ncbi:MAG: RnfABCDGE type electron transport complex subunit C [Lachnospiraceae bacterium]|nr:RnfABCDGE type electron transport complex subunit C [Lachnospiraceae bacterium]
MAHFTFHGGISLREHKERTKDLNIEEVLPGRYVVFPMLHHEKELVIPGEYVLTGQLLAKSDDDSLSRIHSSVSGIVKGIEERMTIQGVSCSCIVVENDEKYKEIDFGDFVEADDLENRQILARIMSAGVVDTVGTVGSVYHKLNVKEPQKIRHIIVNCAECEPYLTSKYRLAVERPEWIVEGLRILLKLFSNAKGILAIENEQQEAITSLQKILADSKNMKIIPMKRKYPQDTERMLIYSCTGKAINSSKTAEDARCVVLNSDTVYAICNAVTFGKPMYKRLMTVSGECVKNPKNIEVSVGTQLSELVAKTGEFLETPDKLICGGPMTGNLLNTLEVPVTKEISAVLCLKEDQHPAKHTPACIGCGYCVDVCNEQLLPTRLVKAAMAGKSEQFIKLGGMECCECGSCSYICPSKRPLTQLIRMMKKQIETEKDN